MPSIINRLMGHAPTNDDVVVLDLQLRLLVAMAAADERISPLELAQIYDFVARHAVSPEDEERMRLVAERLLARPPRIEDLLQELGQYAQRGELGAVLAEELAQVAQSDDVIDHREEFLFRMVCDLFGVEHEPLRQATGTFDVAELRGFVGRLAAGDWRKD